MKRSPLLLTAALCLLASCKPQSSPQSVTPPEPPAPPKINATDTGEKTEEWFRAFGEIENGTVKASLPPKATHAYINLVDENNVLVSHPRPVPAADKNNTCAHASLPLVGTAKP